MNDTKAFTACGSGYFNSLIKAMLKGFPTYVGGKKKILIYHDLQQFSPFLWDHLNQQNMGKGKKRKRHIETVSGCQIIIYVLKKKRQWSSIKLGYKGVRLRFQF